MNILRLTIFIALMFIGLTGELFAQLVNVESQRIQSDTIRFAGNINANFSFQKTNDIPLTELKSSAALQLKSTSLKNIFLIIGNYNVSKSKDLNLNNAGFGHIRYNYKFNKTIRFEAYNQLQFNRLLSLRYRYIVGTGVRLKINKNKIFKMYLGLSSFYEYEEILDQNKSINTDFRFSSYLVLSLKMPKESGEFTSITYFQPLFKSINDFRLTNQSSIALNLTKNIAFTSTFTYFFDSKPPKDIIRESIALENGIRLTF
jgi:hypothetical protein